MAAEKQSPIDSGYSYVIMAVVFLAHFLQYGFTWTVGVWYTVFMSEYSMDSKYVALISSLNTAFFYAAGPIAGFLTNAVGARIVCIIGAVIASIGIVCSMFATNVYILYVTFGIIAGFGLGLSYIPGVTMVGYYFEKRRSLAMGVAVSGCGIGTFIFPALINYLITHYSLSGALLIMGAFNLNLVVIAAFYRPWNGERNLEIVIDDEEDKQDNDVLISDTRLNILKPKPHLLMDSRPSLYTSRPSLFVSKMSLKGSNATINSIAARRKIHHQQNFCRTISICDLQPGVLYDSCQELTPSQGCYQSVRGSRSMLGSRSIVGSRSILDSRHRINGSVRALSSNQQEYSHVQLNLEEGDDVSRTSVTSKLSLINKFNMDIFRNMSYLMLCLNNMLFCFGLSIVYIHLGSYAKETLQLTAQQSGHFFSAIGIANFAGRFAFGAICQVPFFKPMCVYSMAFLASGVVTQLCPLFDDHTWVMAYAVVFGFLSGSFGALLPSVIIQVTELDKLTSAYGYLLVFEAIGTLFGAPLAGLLYDVTGIYKNSFYMGGAFMIASALVMIHPIKYGRTEKEIEDELSVDFDEAVRDIKDIEDSVLENRLQAETVEYMSDLPEIVEYPAEQQSSLPDINDNSLVDNSQTKEENVVPVVLE